MIQFARASAIGGGQWRLEGLLRGRGGTERAALTGHAAGTSFVLLPAVGPAIAAGDGFAVAAGCDKKFATCKAKFGNALNFRGFPHLPGNDAAYGYVADGGVFDGRPVVP